MRLRFAGLVTVVAASSLLTVVFSACSGGDPRPDAGNTDFGGSSSGGTTVVDAGKDSAADADAATTTCGNGQKDGDETDVDCGGTCKPCEETKLCAKKEDCVSGLECEIAEVGKPEKKCRVGTCLDTATNGGETDLNCGGTTGCNRCTVGKRCAADTDCRTGKCNNQACACPANMTIVTLSGGGAYCIDSAEVTKGEYNKFITANVPTTSQTGPCTTNTTFVPSGAWPPASDPPPGGNGLAYNFGLPVHYVDWCDATAYCKWAKKELCGKIGGGSIPQGDANTAGTAAWYNACSAQGTKTYPYGTDFIASKCNDVGGADGGAPGYGYVQNEDDGLYQATVSNATGDIVGYSNQGCQGGYVGLYQMSGNASEWENSCTDETTPTATCNVRGGSYTANADSTQLKCDAARQVSRLAPKDALKDIGFRCCLY